MEVSALVRAVIAAAQVNVAAGMSGAFTSVLKGSGNSGSLLIVWRIRM